MARKRRSRRLGRRSRWAREMAGVMQALANESRCALLVKLREGPQDATNIARDLGKPVSTVRAQLNRLEKVRLVKSKRISGGRPFRLGDRVSVIAGRQSVIVDVKLLGGQRLTFMHKPLTGSR